MNTADVLLYSVEIHETGQRLDLFIAGRLADCTRSHAAWLIRQGHIRVDDQTCKPSHKVKPQEQVRVCLPVPQPSQLIAEPLALQIIYEDRDLIVINKPAGMVVHPAAGHSSGTLVHGILHHCPDLEGIGGEKRPGIVHRLDKETSGLLVVAKNEPALNGLAAQFKSRSIRKQYLALVHDSPQQDSGVIDLPVGRHPVERKRMSTNSARAREALTLWRVEAKFPGITLLALDLKTGRTHQIRVHCQAMGFPIVGDPVYGRKGALKASAALHQVLKQARRQMLHAYRLGFRHPIAGCDLTFEAPLPDDMAAILAQLHQLQV
jgi:23S rRNA pseudouridine1911/1915/1917 synthase